MPVWYICTVALSLVTVGKELTHLVSKASSGKGQTVDTQEDGWQSETRAVVTEVTEWSLARRPFCTCDGRYGACIVPKPQATKREPKVQGGL